MATIGSLVINLQAEIAGFRSNLNRATSAMNSSTARMNRNLDTLNRSFTRLGNVVRGTLGAAGIGLSVTALTNSINRAVRAADQIDQVARRVGVSAEALQELRFAAEQVGVQSNTLDMALQRFSRRLGEAAAGTGELRAIIEQYDIQLRETDGSIRSVEDVLLDYAEVVQGAASDQEQLRLAFKAFDSEGAALVNLLREGRIGMEEFAERARDLGLVMEQDLINRSAELRRGLDEVGQVLRVNFSAGLLDGFLRDSETLRDIYTDPAFRESAHLFGEVFGTLAREAARSMQSLAQILQGNFGEEALDGTAIGLGRRVLEDFGVLGGRAAGGGAGGGTTDTLPPVLPPAFNGAGGAVADSTEEIDAFGQALQAANERLDPAVLRLRMLRDGASETAIEAELLARQLIEMATSVEENVVLTPKQVEVLRNLAGEIINTEVAVQEMRSGAEDLANSMNGLESQVRSTSREFSFFIADAITGAENLGQSIDRLIQRFASRGIEQGLSSLFDFGFGQLFGGAGGGSSLGSIGGAAPFAKGGVVTHPTLAMIGEAGRPEAVLPLGRAPDGSMGVQVAANSNFTDVGGGGGGNTYIIDARGADMAAIQRLERALLDLAGPGVVERRAVSAVSSQSNMGGGFSKSVGRRR